MEHHGDDVCGGSYVNVKQNYCTILTVEKLRGGSFLFPPKPDGGIRTARWRLGGDGRRGDGR